MSGWRALPYLIVSLMWLVYPLVYVAYFGTVGVRRGIQRRSAAPVEWSKTVDFHARWGIVLSLPGAMVSILGGLGPAGSPIGALTLLGTIACWAIALEAADSRRIRPWVAWIPLATMFLSLNVLAAFAGITRPVTAANFGTREPLREFVDRYLDGLVLMTHSGLGLAAWLTVTICFALAVRRLRATEASLERVGSPAESALPAPGFVWPH